MSELILERAVLSISPDIHQLFKALAARMHLSFSEFIQTMSMVGTVAVCSKELGYEAIELDCFLDGDFLQGICMAWTAEFDA